MALVAGVGHHAVIVVGLEQVQEDQALVLTVLELRRRAPVTLIEAAVEGARTASQAGRHQILRIQTKKQKLADDVDLEALAAQTHGFVGADITAMCMKAAVRCIREHAKGVLDMDEEDIPPEFLESLRVSMRVSGRASRACYVPRRFA